MPYRRISGASLTKDKRQSESNHIIYLIITGNISLQLSKNKHFAFVRYKTWRQKIQDRYRHNSSFQDPTTQTQSSKHTAKIVRGRILAAE